MPDHSLPGITPELVRSRYLVPSVILWCGSVLISVRDIYARHSWDQLKAAIRFGESSQNVYEAAVRLVNNSAWVNNLT
jgi:hypothetical protein